MKSAIVASVLIAAASACNTLKTGEKRVPSQRENGPRLFPFRHEKLQPPYHL
jgi:hypothetical protein